MKNNNKHVHGYVVFDFLQLFLMWRRNERMFEHLRIFLCFCVLGIAGFLQKNKNSFSLFAAYQILRGDQFGHPFNVSFFLSSAIYAFMIFIGSDVFLCVCLMDIRLF